MLGQHKERTPKDPTIRAHDPYRFADHAADLLVRVCTASVETMKIVDARATPPLR